MQNSHTNTSNNPSDFHLPQRPIRHYMRMSSSIFQETSKSQVLHQLNHVCLFYFNLKIFYFWSLNKQSEAEERIRQLLEERQKIYALIDLAHKKEKKRVNCNQYHILRGEDSEGHRHYLVFALMPDRSTEAYKWLFRQLKTRVMEVTSG